LDILGFGLVTLAELRKDENTFKHRTRNFGLQAIALVESLPRSRTADVLGRQLLRCATSVGANYRAACRGKSAADVLAKLAIVEEEADESMYWMEMLVDSGALRNGQAEKLLGEADEIIAMTVASIKTLRKRSAGP
jgi:four helix bundle protein